MSSTHSADLVVVGAGIAGLAHALAAARLGLKVIVVDREAQANGASIRNFGFITVTGQQQGECWRRARRSRDVWAEIAPQAGIEICHDGLAVAVRRKAAMDVLDAFSKTEMGEDCALLTGSELRQRIPAASDAVIGGLWSPHELRIESRSAIPLLAAWLERAHGVTILRQTLVTGIALPHVETTAGRISAERIVVCPGDDFLTLFPKRIAAYGLTRCILQMLRVAPGGPTSLGAAVMSDLSLVRYLGYAELPEAAPLKQEILREEPEMLENGIHLIAVQSGDGSLVVGDSHHYAPSPPPFADAAVEALMLKEFDRILAMPGRLVRERWTGIYASASDRLMLIDKPDEKSRIVIITSGTGASTSFAIAEEVIADLMNGTAA